MAAIQEFRMDPRHVGSGHLGDDLAVRLEGYIERRACGQIRDLHVVCAENRITLQGRSRTYHAKQLAQEAALDLAEGDAILANEIIVA